MKKILALILCVCLAMAVLTACEDEPYEPYKQNGPDHAERDFGHKPAVHHAVRHGCHEPVIIGTAGFNIGWNAGRRSVIRSAGIHEQMSVTAAERPLCGCSLFYQPKKRPDARNFTEET